MSEVLTEGRVSKNILSFGGKTFLFTGTVCKAWRENSVDTETGDWASIESLSRLNEALEYTYPERFLFKCLHHGADMEIIEQLDYDGCVWDEEDLTHAADQGRKDVLQFLHESGIHLDKKVFHTAVRYNHLELAKYLLSIGCPVDKTVFDWGVGPNIHPALAMRSMELAIRNSNVEMVKTLRTVDYPFDDSTFRTACESKNVEMMNYLHEQGCEPDDGLFYNLHLKHDFDMIEVLCRMGYGRDEWDNYLSLYILRGEERLVTFLLGEGIIPTDDAVDSAILSGNLKTAKLLTENYPCRPTTLAYMCFFGRKLKDCRILQCYHWLYYDMECGLGFSSLEEMKNDSRGWFMLVVAKGAVLDWLKERLV